MQIIIYPINGNSVVNTEWIHGNVDHEPIVNAFAIPLMDIMLISLVFLIIFRIVVIGIDMYNPLIQPIFHPT